MPETRKYDKFYIDELVKKYPTQEKLDSLIVSINEIEAAPTLQEYELKFHKVVDLKSFEAEQAKRQLEEEKSQQVKTVTVNIEWNPEEIATLTKAIVKFPPGYVQRWQTIADFCGKSQKVVIAKAKEIQEKSKANVEANRAAITEMKDLQERAQKEG